MSREEILDKLTEIFRDIFDDDTIELDEDVTSNDIDGWDSLMNITIVATLEEEFDIQFSMKDIALLKNIGGMIDKISELLD